MQKFSENKLEVNFDNILYNINSIKKLVGSEVGVMPVIKDNAYGTYINKKLDFLNKLDVHIVGVACVDEGAQIREIGYENDIFILNQPLESEIPAIAKYNLTVGVGSIDFLKKLGSYNSKFKIHIEIGSGMGRTGIRPSRINEYIDEVNKYDNVLVEGIYTHFSSSDSDEEYTEKQIKSFESALEVVKERIGYLKYIHCCNSGGVINFKKAYFNLVRPGLILYGYFPNKDFVGKIDIKPCVKLKSKISFLKEVDEGTSIGYDRSFITKRKTKVANVPIGYGDGFRRCMSNKGSVLINGQKANIIGKICMDCFMVDVTELDEVNVGDDVFLWDNENIFVEDVAKLYDTINYEVLVSLSDRILREFV